MLSNSRTTTLQIFKAFLTGIRKNPFICDSNLKKMMCNIYNGMSFCVLFLYMYYMYLAYEVIWFYCNSLMLIITCVCWCVKYWYFDTISAVLLCRLRYRPSTPCVDTMDDWLALSLLFLLGKIVTVTIQLVFISKILCESSEILHCMFSRFQKTYPCFLVQTFTIPLCKMDYTEHRFMYLLIFEILM